MDSPPTTPMQLLVVKLLEAPPYHAPPQFHHDSPRPTIGFPLGAVLAVIIVLTLSSIFSCFYHWDKLRYLRGDFSDDNPHHSDHDPPSKLKPDCLMEGSNPATVQEEKVEEDRILPVIMAGDQFPSFIAMPCPCEPPSQGKMNGPPHVVIPIN